MIAIYILSNRGKLRGEFFEQLVRKAVWSYCFI